MIDFGQNNWESSFCFFDKNMDYLLFTALELTAVIKGPLGPENSTYILSAEMVYT